MPMGLSSKITTRLKGWIDMLYLRPLSRIMDIRTFRYAAAGGINFALGVVLYWFLFNIVLSKQDTNFCGIITISAPILAFLINFVVTFFSGFWLTRSLAFEDSRLRGSSQLMRYALTVALNIAINYFGLKFLIELCSLYPTPSYMLLQVITITISYLSSRYFIFRR